VWQPNGRSGPAVMAAHNARVRHARGTTGHGGTGGHGSPTDPLLRGRGQGHEGGGRVAPGKMSNGMAHRRGRASLRWWGETGEVTFRQWRTARGVRAIRCRTYRSVRGGVR
jgi:hypothetical protein